MRAIPPCVACVMILLGLTATTPLADPSIVADLDSNATNGPDTLQADVGDTVLVRVWITDSADSLVGFGITVGDTSGALTWIEEEAESVYMTPSGWLIIPVQVDENGRLLLQGQDFAYTTPLHIPRQVAELKFIAAQPDSCATLTWDPAMSGWQNWEFDVGEFASFEGAVVCVAGQGDGGGDQGEGGEDDMPIAGPYPCEPDLIEVMFAWDSRVRLRNGVLVDLETDALDGVSEALADFESVQWTRGCPVSEDTLDMIQERGEDRTGRAVYNLNNIYRLRIPKDSDVWEVSRALEELPGTHLAKPVPLPVEPPECSPPDFQPLQEYMDHTDSVPSGIDAEYAWTQPGGTGSGVTVCDVEYDWLYGHADLTKASGSQICPYGCNDNPWNRYHGTKVLGVLVSDENGWGTTGICHGSDVKTSCVIYLDTAYADTVTWNVPGAIATAIANLSAGDVILLEQQWDYLLDMDPGPPYDHVPIEWWERVYPDSQQYNPVYAAIDNAVANGINVVECGGNGNVDTDLLNWYGNSGAIIVGASAAYAGNRRRYVSDTWGSSYGSRFDLQAWGDDVTTTSYFRDPTEGCDLYDSGDSCCYTAGFGGTSSAGAIVAGSVASFVGYWKANVDSLVPPTPEWVRSLLKSTGNPQEYPPEGDIGPLPNLRAAIGAIQTATGLRHADHGGPSRRLVWTEPNPFNPEVSITVEMVKRGTADLMIFNAAGRRIRLLWRGDLSEGRHSFLWGGDTDEGGTVPSGVYFCKVRTDIWTEVRRMVLIR